VVLPPPIVSGRRTKHNSQLILPSILSELSFDHEVLPIPDLNEIMNGSKDRIPNDKASSKSNNKNNIDDETPSKSAWSSWTSGLLCFSSGDPDLFFDAEESLSIISTKEEGMDCDGKIILPPMKLSVSSSEISAESIESVEAKLVENEGSSAVTASTKICYEIRGGNQDPRYMQQQHNELRTVAGFGSRVPPQEKEQPNHHHNPYTRVPAPPAPKELPIRFLRAGKGDPVEGQRRYEATLQWRKENGIDNILFESHPLFEMVKSHYPHYFHLRGKKGEPVFYEQPPKTDLPALRAGGMDLKGLVRYYTMITEFQWQFIERDDLARSITVLDLEGMRMMDFAGEVIEYVKMCSKFTGQHYPERAGHVIVVNVPRWFAMIWKVVRPMVDEVTLRKISIVRGKEAVFEALAEKIAVENIPPEYGGKSVPLGKSPEEIALRDLMKHNNALARKDYSCTANPIFHSWGPVRSY